MHLLPAALLLFILASCGPRASQVILASTTSVDDAGLFDVLLPAFHEAHPEYALKVVAVGSGQALALGARRDADVLLVHSPADERAFIEAGHGLRRLPVMTNAFILVGPEADPAGVRGGSFVADAMRRIAAAASSGDSAQRIRWVSRGDSSGTHVRELQLWRDAGVTPDRAWYLDVGQGMGETLAVASGRDAYTITDAATWTALRRTLDLAVIIGGNGSLLNEYSVIPVTGARNAEGADAFAQWIVSPPAQALIGSFGVEQFGEPLFTPMTTAR